MEKTQRVLVVDDQPALRGVVKRILAQSGIPMEICEADCGAGALDRLRESSFDLVVLDVRMPGELNGFDVLRRLRESEATQELAVVMLTAESRDEDIFEGLEGGATSYVTKPFNAEELWQVVEPHLDGRASQAPDAPKAGAAKRVLLVDDEDAVRQIMRRALRNSAFEVEVSEAADGEDALALFRESRFDIMVLDVSMPRVGGLEVLKAVRERFSLPELPVIMLSGETEPLDMLKGISGGASSYLTKPFDAADVVLVIDYHLANASQPVASE